MRKRRQAKRPRGTLLVVLIFPLLIFLLASCRSQTQQQGKDRSLATSTSLSEVASLVSRYYARANPEVTVKVVAVEGSEHIPGWRQGTLEWSTGGAPQKMPFLVSSDGRYFIPGEVIDLTEDPLQAIMDKIALEGRPSRGPADATVVMVEYGDFQCPFCLRAYDTIENKLLKQYGDRMRFYFKHLPLKKLHPWAERAAVAAECAANQSPEAFWKFYNLFFTRQKEISDGNLESKVASWAREAGLDAKRFSACLRTGKTKERVQADIAEAAAVGVSSTPTFIINGHRIVGAQPLEVFTEIVDGEAAKALAGRQ